MTGIDAVDVALPRYRVDADTVRGATGDFDARIDGKTLLGPDEDAVTMGIDAARRLALDGLGLLAVGSTTRPQPGTLAAGPIARSLGIQGGLRTTAHGAAWTAGLEALEAALESGDGLVVATDAPSGEPGSAMDSLFGAGAAALRTGDGAVAELVGAAHHVDARLPARFESAGAVTDLEIGGYAAEGLAEAVGRVVKTVLAEADRDPADIAHVVLPQEDVKAGWRLGGRLGFEDGQCSAGWVVDRLGFAGAATPVIGLVNALGAAEPGQLVLVTAYGHGEAATGLLFEAGAGVDGVAIDVADRVERATPVDGPRYLALRGGSAP